MSFSIKNLGFNKTAVLENGKQIHVCTGFNSVNEAKQYIEKSYQNAVVAPQKRGNISEVVAEMQAIQDNIGSFDMSMVESYTAEQINGLIENYSSFTQTNEEVQNPSLTAWIGRHHYSQKTYVESMDEPVNPGKNDTDKWQAKEQDPKPAENVITRAASTITISQQKAGLYGHGPFGVTRDFETKVEPNPYVGKTQLSGPNESVEDLSEAELDEMISEVLGKNADAGKWIEDFIKSDNPKFAGKSKEKRKQMALAAYYAKQNEEVEGEEYVVELPESINLNETIAVHGKYTIKSGPAVTGMGEGNPEHVKGHLGKLKQLGISTAKGEKYGQTHRVSVTNNETGEKTHHHVYQREYYDKKPVVSVRDVGAGKKDQSAHHEVLKGYLSGKKADTTAVKEAVELGNEGEFKKASKKFAKAANQEKQGKPEGSLEVKEDTQIDELSKTTLKNYVKDASSDRAGNSFTMGYEAGAGRQPKEKAHEYDAKRRKGIAKAVDRLTKESFADFIFGGEIIREELTYEINEADKNYDAYFKEMMKKAGITSIGDLKTDDAKKEFMNSVDAGFKAKNEENIIENFMRSDVEEKAAAHRKAGHKVSDVKFSTKDNKPHAEYTVTTTDGDKKKYIYHGSARKLETLA